MADILVVDDSWDVASPLIMFLKMEGHAVRYADDGQAGLHEINERFPELIFLDIEMPRLNGPDMAYRLLIEDCGKEAIPIFVLSAVSDLAEVAARIGTPYFMPKPFDLDKLEAILNRALRERLPPQPALSQRLAA